MGISENIKNLQLELAEDVTLVAVSKTKPVEDILEAYEAGQHVFGENKIQEMVDKWELLPKDISWHMIGHVQTNKVKYMAAFVSLIHGVDSMKLLKEINKQAVKHDRSISCLLQIKIAEEDSKFGLSEADATAILNSEALKELSSIKIEGFMGMATFTDDEAQLENEFNKLKTFYDLHKESAQLNTLSMGMSADYLLAVTSGSNMIRVGSSIFGARNYQ